MMIEAANAQPPQVSGLISDCLWKFYTTNLSPKLTKSLVQCRLIERHAQFWEHLLAAEETCDLRDAMLHSAADLKIPEELLNAADAQTIWTLTPEIAASLACGAGTEAISLRKIASALESILHGALRALEQRRMQEDYSQAA